MINREMSEKSTKPEPIISIYTDLTPSVTEKITDCFSNRFKTLLGRLSNFHKILVDLSAALLLKSEKDLRVRIIDKAVFATRRITITTVMRVTISFTPELFGAITLIAKSEKVPRFGITPELSRTNVTSPTRNIAKRSRIENAT
jgi:hypothetical protein